MSGLLFWGEGVEVGFVTEVFCVPLSQLLVCITDSSAKVASLTFSVREHTDHGLAHGF